MLGAHTGAGSKRAIEALTRELVQETHEEASHPTELRASYSVGQGSWHFHGRIWSGENLRERFSFAGCAQDHCQSSWCCRRRKTDRLDIAMKTCALAWWPGFPRLLMRSAWREATRKIRRAMTSAWRVVAGSVAAWVASAERIGQSFASELRASLGRR